MMSDGRLVARIWAKVRKTTRGPEVIQIVLRSRLEFGRDWTIPPCSSVSKRKRKSIFMPRKDDASRSRRNSYQRVDPKQYTIWPSLGHKSLQSQRKIQCWSSGSIFVSRSNRILDSNCERYWQNLSEKPCRSKRKRKLRWNPLQKRDLYLNRHTQVVGALFLLDRENGLTLKHRNQMILVVFKCQNSCLDYYDTVKKFIEKMMEQSNMTKLLMNASESNSTILNIDQLRWRRTSSMLRIGRLKNGCQFWQKVEDKRKDFNIAWIRTIPINSCSFEQFKDVQEVQSILHCKTMYCYRKVLRVYLPRRQRKRIEVNSEPWFESRKSQSQNGQISCILHHCESDG